MDVSIKVPERNKRPGVAYAVTPDGVEVAVVDVQNPLFVRQYSSAELERIRHYSMQQWGKSRRTPKFLLRFLSRRSILYRGTLEAAHGYVSGMASYFQKMGPDMLGRGYAGRLDRKLANYIGPVCMRLRLAAVAGFLADALASSLEKKPDGPAWLINIAGGPSADSLNALIRLRSRRPDLLKDRQIRIWVLDKDNEGPCFAKRCLEALIKEGGELHGLDAELHHQPYDWRQPDELRAWCSEMNIAQGAHAISSEGGLFEYGSDHEVVSNLRVLKETLGPDCTFVGTVFRDEPLPRKVKELGKLTLQPRSKGVLSDLIQRGGWELHLIDESNPMSYVVSIRSPGP